MLKKTWRDAATLIIAGKRGVKNSLSSLKAVSSSEQQGLNKNSGKLARPVRDVIAGNLALKSDAEADFDVLLLKRSSKSRFMASEYKIMFSRVYKIIMVLSFPHRHGPTVYWILII